MTSSALKQLMAENKQLTLILDRASLPAPSKKTTFLMVTKQMFILHKENIYLPDHPTGINTEYEDMCHAIF
jgi:hypothetical protein